VPFLRLGLVLGEGASFAGGGSFGRGLLLGAAGGGALIWMVGVFAAGGASFGRAGVASALRSVGTRLVSFCLAEGSGCFGG
jgi:hypothetical protein